MTTGQLELPLFEIHSTADNPVPPAAVLDDDLAREREAIRSMEVLTYNCGARREYHDPHTRTDGRRCPGLQTRQCTSAGEHPHHRWWVIPDAFYWCNGFSLPRLRGRRVEDVELP